MNGRELLKAKYLSKKRVNNKWVYKYKESEGSGRKQAANIGRDKPKASASAVNSKQDAKKFLASSFEKYELEDHYKKNISGSILKNKVADAFMIPSKQVSKEDIDNYINDLSSEEMAQAIVDTSSDSELKSMTNIGRESKTYQSKEGDGKKPYHMFSTASIKSLSEIAKIKQSSRLLAINELSRRSLDSQGNYSQGNPYKNLFDIEDNPLNSSKKKLLVDAAAGKFDLKKQAHLELSNRGLTTEGDWIGVEQAKELHKEHTERAVKPSNFKKSLSQIVGERLEKAKYLSKKKVNNKWKYVYKRGEGKKKALTDEGQKKVILGMKTDKPKSKGGSEKNKAKKFLSTWELYELRHEFTNMDDSDFMKFIAEDTGTEMGELNRDDYLEGMNKKQTIEKLINSLYGDDHIKDLANDYDEENK